MATSSAATPSVAGPNARDRGHTLILICFFVSGACGLIYEIIWSRLLTLVMGATIYSLTTVLVAFMAGLGLGAWIIGILLRRHPGWNRLRLYGIFEIIIGIWCLGLPWMMHTAQPLFGFFYNHLYGNDPASLFKYSLAQLAICAPLMLVPTTLMGATLPLLADHMVRRRGHVGQSVGLVYGINTFGAMAGALSAGYLLIPVLGFSHSNLLAVGGNLLVGLTAISLARREKPITDEVEESESTSLVEEKSKSPIPLWVVFAVFCISGFAAMSYQIAWTRVISLIIDSTTYSFTIIVTSYILGLAVGSSSLAKMIDREKRPVTLLGVVVAAVGLTGMVTLPIMGLLPAWVFFLMIRFQESWVTLQIIILLLVIALLLIPTMLMGAIFPLVAKICSRKRGDVGPVVGKAYAWNALGTIAGSFITGFLLIPNPSMGMERTLVLMTLVNVVLGAAVLLASRESAVLRRMMGIAVLAGLWVGGFFLCMRVNSEGDRGWDRDILTSSPFFFYEQFFRGSIQADLDFRGFLAMQGERVDYREGPFSTVVVRRINRGGHDQHMIFTGGRPEASDSDIQQHILTHLGMMLSPDPRRVCVIGLGSGTTAQSATYHPSLEQLDVVEISQAVADVSAKYFPHVHADLEAAGANIIIADGRNHLALTDQTYDVIVSQPSHPHLTGVASLFTEDFFQICRDRLSDNGICVIWNFAWRVEPEMFRTYVRSFQSVFPASFFMLSDGSYTFLVGFKSDEPILDWNLLAQRLEECTDPRLREDRRVSDDQAMLLWSEPQHIINSLTLGPMGIQQFAGVGPLNTDDNALLEYALPRSFNVDKTSQIQRRCRIIRDRLTPNLGEEWDPAIHESVWGYVINAPPEAIPPNLRDLDADLNEVGNGS